MSDHQPTQNQPAQNQPTRRQFLQAGLLTASLPGLAAAETLDEDVARELANRLRYLTPPDGLPPDLAFRPSPDVLPFLSDLHIPAEAVPILDLTALTFYLPQDEASKLALPEACQTARKGWTDAQKQSLPCPCRSLEWQVKETIKARRIANANAKADCDAKPKPEQPACRDAWNVQLDPADRTNLLRLTDFEFVHCPLAAGTRGQPFTVALTRQEREELAIEDQLWLVWFRGLCLQARKSIQERTACLVHPPETVAQPLQGRLLRQGALRFIEPCVCEPIGSAGSADQDQLPSPRDLGVPATGLDIGAPPDWRAHQRFFELKPKKLYVKWELEFPWIYQDSTLQPDGERVKNAIKQMMRPSKRVEAPTDQTSDNQTPPTADCTPSAAEMKRLFDPWGHGSWTWGYGSLVRAREPQAKCPPPHAPRDPFRLLGPAGDCLRRCDRGERADRHSQ